MDGESEKRIRPSYRRIFYSSSTSLLHNLSPSHHSKLIHSFIFELFLIKIITNQYECNNDCLQARTKVAEELGLIVRQRRKQREAGDEKKDMLAALLAGDDGFSDEQIVDFLLALLVAGYETTSTIMTLAVKFLTETPMALAQLKVSSLLVPFGLTTPLGL